MKNTNELEEWKPVVGFEGLYEVSNLGRVRSIDREITLSNGRTRKLKGKIRKQLIMKDGRPVLVLNKNGKQYNEYPHTLLALAFLGERPEDYQICHIDGDCTNNKLSNLRYDTGSENMIDMYRYGKKAGRGKLDIHQVLEIRNLYATGNYKQRELAEKFNVGQENISLIVNRKNFSWLNDDGSITESATSVS